MADLYFTKEELNFISDKKFFRLKASVTQKVITLLNSLQTEIEKLLIENNDLLPGEVVRSTPKISRGENYNGFPWLVLDYPRVFTANDVFAFRTLFWWGNSFVFAFQLSGKSRSEFEPTLLSKLKTFPVTQCKIAVTENPWIHDPEDASYIELNRFLVTHTRPEEMFKNQPFIKLIKKVDFSRMEKLTDEAMHFYRQCIGLISP